MNTKPWCLPLLISSALGFTCAAAYAQEKEWIWMNGSSTVGTTCTQYGGGATLCGQPGVYGTLGVPAAGNVPAGRDSAAAWTDSNGNFWLFGGEAFSSGSYYWVNELWKFSPATREWVLMDGGDPASNDGEYGALGSPGVLNIPGARSGASTWTDPKGNLWLFAGGGTSSYQAGYLNDLWEFQPSAGAWTWVSGSKTLSCVNVDGYGLCGVPGVPGDLGIPAAANVPTGRADATSWTDSNGSLWVFGGGTLDYQNPNETYLNDLWMFNPSTGLWTWMSGTPVSSYSGQPGVYGTLGQFAAANVPGGRDQASGWTGRDGSLWLFGGFGFDVNGNVGWLNSLWEFNPTSQQWSWMGGSSTVPSSGTGQPGVYGTQGIAAAANVPGGRSGATAWTDANGNFWLFGGNGFDSNGNLGYLNDIWEFNPTSRQWAWVGGSSTVGSCTQNGRNTDCGQAGVYGVLGAPAAGNSPGGRQHATGWTDANGNLWLFGGFGADSSGAWGELNDLWAYQVSSTSFPTAAPDFSLAPAIYAAPFSVSLSDLTPGATIYYTTDGTTPTNSSTAYTNAIAISTSQTIKAIALAPGYGISAVASGAYILRAPIPSRTTLAVTAAGAAAVSVPVGTAVTLTATVQAGGAAATTGQVNFCDAAAAYCADIHLLGTAQLTRTGKAQLKFTPGVGSHSYKAVFAGTAHTYASSSSSVAALTVTAGKFATTTSIAQAGSGADYTLTATVNGSVFEIGLPTPTGQVTFLDTTNGNAVLGSATLVAGVSSLGWSVFQTLDTGSVPQAVAVGDFNGDGIPDLAVADSGDGTVTIFLGKGDGTFTPVLPSPSARYSPSDLAVGDFNGDGLADLAVANTGDNSVSILLGRGDGTFTTIPASIPVSTAPFAIAVADFNGDGIPDLAVAGAKVTILLGNGDGTFTQAPNSPSPGNFPTAMAVGDFNGDGKADIVVTDRLGGYEGSATILLGNGDGTFTAAVSPDAGFGPEAVAVGDFNGDGKADLAIADSGGVKILLGNGDGTFAGSSVQLGPVALFGIVVGDFNGDGKADLAAVNYESAAAVILLGQGDGTFMAAPANAAPAGGDYPHSIAVGDFNGDGIQDLVTADYNPNIATPLLTVLQQTATATVTGISPSPGPQNVVASYSGDGTFAASISSPTALNAAQPPAVNAGGVLNSGSYTTQGVAPGSIVSIFGTNLAASTASASAIPLPTSLSDVTSVTFNGIPAGLYFVSQDQINAQLPFNLLPGLDSGTVSIAVTRGSGTSAPQAVTVVPVSPGIFTTTSNGTGQAFAYDNNTGALAAPAGAPIGPFTTAPISVSSGHALIIACTGLGSVTPSIDNYVAASDGTLRYTVMSPTVLIGGFPAQLVYSVLSPQFVSEYQIGVIPAAGTPTGNWVPLQIQIGGVTTTDQVTIAVAP